MPAVNGFRKKILFSEINLPTQRGSSMEQFFSLSNLFTLAMLTLLQAVLGFDNLLYISLESKRAPLQQQAMVRRLGIGIAIFFRIILLFILMNLIQYFQKPSDSAPSQNPKCPLNFLAVLLLLRRLEILTISSLLPSDEQSYPYGPTYPGVSL